MLIGDVARQFGVQTSAIRFYESMGLLPKAVRVNKRRQYSADVILRLKLIKTAQSMGFTIRELKLLMQGFDSNSKQGKKWEAFAEEKILELDQLIQKTQSMKKLLRMALDCQCVALTQCEILK
jgi:MerR family transcriptional regulator, redox-sensitive transcriptional activator SoxR